MSRQYSGPTLAACLAALLLQAVSLPAALASSASQADVMLETFLLAGPVAGQRPLPAAPRDSSWFDEPELRIGGQWQDGQQDWAWKLRLRPRSAGQQQGEQRLLAAQHQQASTELALLTVDSLQLRYQWVLDALAARNAVAVLRRAVALAQQRLAVLRDLAAGGAVDPLAMQRAAMGLDNSQRELSLAQAHWRALQASIGGTAGFVVQLPVGDAVWPPWLVPPEHIVGRIQASQAELPAAVPSLRARLAKTRHDQARAALDRDLQDSRFGLSFIEFDRDQGGAGSAGLTVGFRLPFTRPGKHHRRHLDVAVAAAGLAAEQDSTRLQRVGLTMALEQQYQSWRALRAQAWAAVDRQQQGSFEAQVALALAQQQLRLDAEASAAHLAMLRSYVELLANSGQLLQQPLRNWLRAFPHEP